MSKKIIRKFRMLDEKMFERAGVFYSLVKKEKAAFADHFSFVTNDYLSALRVLIDNAQACSTDVGLKLDLKVLTQNIREAMGLGCRALSALSTYARLAFAEEHAKRKTFARTNWPGITSSQASIVAALVAAHALATQAPYAAALAAKGYTAAHAATLLSLAQAIETANQVQESAKSNRPVSTEDRVLAYNAVWDVLKEISLMSTVVYHDSPADRKNTAYTPEKGTRKKPAKTMPEWQRRNRQKRKKRKGRAPSASCSKETNFFGRKPLFSGLHPSPLLRGAALWPARHRHRRAGH